MKSDRDEPKRYAHFRFREQSIHFAPTIYNVQAFPQSIRLPIHPLYSLPYVNISRDRRRPHRHPKMTLYCPFESLYTSRVRPISEVARPGEVAALGKRPWHVPRSEWFSTSHGVIDRHGTGSITNTGDRATTRVSNASKGKSQEAKANSQSGHEEWSAAGTERAIHFLPSACTKTGRRASLRFEQYLD